MKASDFFTWPESLASFAESFPLDVPPWEWVKRIGQALSSRKPPKKAAAAREGVHIEGTVWIHETARVAPGSVLIGPIFVGPGSEIGPSAYLRGNVIVGAGSRIGHGAEVKNSLILDEVEAPHRPYIGDSVLGNGSHLAAGAVCSNLRLDRGPVRVRSADGDIETGLRKLGAIVGDQAEVGCNAVLNPGTVLGRRSLVMPAIAYGGHLPDGMIARVRQSVTLIQRRD